MPWVLLSVLWSRYYHLPVLIFVSGMSWNIATFTGEPRYGSRVWKCWASVCWQRWYWKEDGGLTQTETCLSNFLFLQIPSLNQFTPFQIIEIPNHRYFVGAQFHPEFKSRPSKPSPLFVGKMLSLVQNFALFQKHLYCFENGSSKNKC